MVNADPSGNSVEMGAVTAQEHEPNGSLDTSLCPRTLEVGNPVYKLMIQIERIKSKPCPKSKKFGYASVVKTQENVKTSVSIVSTEQKSTLPRKQVTCSTCNETFQSAQSLYLHKKKQHRFVCPICDAYCATKVICERHEKLHVSNDPLLPHKCHLCSQKFDTKRNVRLHTRVIHSFLEPTTIGKSSNPLAKENSSRVRTTQAKQIAQPAEKIIDLDIKETKVNSMSRRNDARNASNYGAVTFTCRVCCQDFTTVEAAEAHTREHMEFIEEHKCNICKKIFKNEMSLNTHLAEHLSRALRCPMCPKAFINRATLRIHMKSHGVEK